MFRVFATLFTAAVAAAAFTTAAAAGCYNCYKPRACASCVQQRVIPAKYETYNEHVVVSPGRRVAHHTPARYATVMVPKTVLVAPASVKYENVPAQYATVQRTRLVAPARTVAVRPACNTCGR